MSSEYIGFSEPVTVFQERRLPEPARPAGYSALIATFDLSVPHPRTLYAIATQHRIVEKDGWRLLTPRHAPNPTLEGQLTFALKNEGLDLIILKRLFLAVDPIKIEKWIKSKPTSSYARRIWFLYEWLTGDKLRLPDADKGNYVSVVNPKQQLAIDGTSSSRHRVKNNLPGVAGFCPLVLRTDTIESFLSLDLQARAKEVVADVPLDVLARTAAFLLLSDSKASYAIEGERPPQDRIQRWGRAIGEAGRYALDREELLRLQQIVIGDDRFVQLGIRNQGGFIGQRDRQTQLPLPEHISAAPEDLPSLIDALLAFYTGPAKYLDPVVTAAILAFGFVYIHPFEDGNGRIHRYLIHDVLTRSGFNPPGVVFPISSAILQNMEQYRQTLESYSKRLLPTISWTPTEQLNVHVTNETADFYSFFDATPHVEFLFSCVQKTIEEDLPYETDFLRRYDQFCAQVTEIVDMPTATTDLLFRFLQQNDGKLSRRGREREFARLTDAEVNRVQETYQRIFLES